MCSIFAGFWSSLLITDLEQLVEVRLINYVTGGAFPVITAIRNVLRVRVNLMKSVRKHSTN